MKINIKRGGLRPPFTVPTCFSDKLVVLFVFLCFLKYCSYLFICFCRCLSLNVLSFKSYIFLIHVPSLILQLSCAKFQLWDPFHLISYTTGERLLLAWVHWLFFYRKILLTISIQSSSQWFIFPCSISSTIQGPPLQIIMLFWCVLCTVSLVLPMH